MSDEIVAGNLKTRKEKIAARIMELAYQRLLLTRQIEDIDKSLNQFEGAQAANDMVQKDIDLEKTVAQAKQEANKNTEELND